MDDYAPRLSAACSVYDFAVANGMTVIATMTMPRADYEVQPTLFGYHEIVTSDVSSVTFLVTAKDVDRLKIVGKLAPESVHRGRVRKIHRLVPRAEMAKTIWEQYRALKRFAGIPWGPSYQRLHESLPTLAHRVDVGTADIEALFKAVSDVQNPEAGRAVAFAKEAAFHIKTARHGTPHDSFVVPLPTPSSAHTALKRWICPVEGWGGGLRRRHQPKGWEPTHVPFTVYEHGVEWSMRYGKMPVERCVAYSLCLPNDVIEVFGTAKLAFLRLARLTMKEPVA
jgi:hypothetical protein